MRSCCARAPEPALRPVRYQEVVAAAGERTRTFSGVARAGTESRLSFRVAGTVQRIDAAVGQEVAAGAVLAELDATQYRLQVREAEAGVAQAEAAMRNAEAEYQRVRWLYEGENASKSQLDAARAAAESAPTDSSWPARSSTTPPCGRRPPARWRRCRSRSTRTSRSGRWWCS